MAKSNDTLNNRIAAWGRGRSKSGATGLALALECVQHAIVAPYDWTRMTRLMAATDGSEKARMKKVLEAASGMKLVEDSKQPTGWRAKRSDDAVVRVSVLAAYVDRGTSFASKLLEEGVDNIPALLVKGEKAAAKLTTLTNLVERLLTEGKSVEEVQEAVNAGIQAFVDAQTPAEAA